MRGSGAFTPTPTIRSRSSLEDHDQTHDSTTTKPDEGIRPNKLPSTSGLKAQDIPYKGRTSAYACGYLKPCVKRANVKGLRTHRLSTPAKRKNATTKNISPATACVYLTEKRWSPLDSPVRLTALGTASKSASSRLASNAHLLGFSLRGKQGA